MKIFVILALLVLVASLASTLISVESKSEVRISCNSPTPCKNLIGKAVSEASPGMSINIEAGVFEEDPIEINKALTLKAVSDSKPTIIFERVDIGFNISFESGSVESTRVVFRNLIIDVKGDSDDPQQFDSIAISAVGRNFNELSSGNASLDTLSVNLEGLEISANLGINLQGAALEVTNSIVKANSFGLTSTYGIVTVENSEFHILSYPPNEFTAAISLHQSTSVLVDNLLLGGFLSIAAGDFGSLRLERNVVSGSGNGLVVRDPIDLIIFENVFSDILDSAIGLPLDDCVNNPLSDITGTIEGAGNIFLRNGRDLCPSDFEWPDRFVSNEGT